MVPFNSYIANLKFLGKSVRVPNFALLIVDIYSSKLHVYLMRSLKQILEKLEQFHIDVQNKRKNKNTRLQVDNEFQQVKTKDLNERYNNMMFTTIIRGGKAFAAEQKIREIITVKDHIR